MTLITKPLRIGAVAAAALLGTVAMADAQQAPDKERQPLARDKGSEGKEVREPSGVRQDPGTDQPKAGDRPGVSRPKGAERPAKEPPKGAERPGKDRAKGAERPESDKDRPKGAERPESDKDRPKGAERPESDKDRPKGATRPETDKDRPKGATRPESDKDRPKGAARPESDKDRPKGAEAPGKDRPKGARLSEKQRSEVGAKLRQNRVERTRVQVAITIGARVPRSVRLHPLPAAVFVSVPGYRGHSYFVRDDDTIVIVDTRTYVVVEVIPSSTRAAGLWLTPEQMRLVYTSVPKDRVADIRVRLALGAEVPAHVRLLKFPGDVRARIPELDGYRYIVTGRDVVIVDPQDRDIALVISE